MTLASLLSVALAILGLLGAIGGAAFFVLAMRGRTTVAVLESNNKALNERVDIVEDRERECNDRLTKAETTVKVLTETVTQARAISDLQIKVDRIVEVATGLDLKVEDHFRQVLSRLQEADSR